MSTTTPTKAPAIPITIITGFLGSGKTTLILNLLPQLPKDYKVALLKNEFGDLAIDSKLATASAISGVQELLNGCICCNLVGQLGTALTELRETVSPDRIIIETSGSAFPATLALEVNRLARETGGAYTLDGVASVIDVENWRGYEDTSYTAKLQARYTDIVVLNKWEAAGERRLEEVEDRILDLEIDVPRIRSDRGRVQSDLLLGLDGGLARAAGFASFPAGDGLGGVTNGTDHDHDHDHDHGHDHAHANGETRSHTGDDSNHQSEVNVLSVTLTQSAQPAAEGLDVSALDAFLRAAPREDIYRIKAIFVTRQRPLDPPDGISGGSAGDAGGGKKAQTTAASTKYVLNWAFGRWTITPLEPEDASSHLALEMTIVTARDEADKWRRRIEKDPPFRVAGDREMTPLVKRLL